MVFFHALQSIFGLLLIVSLAYVLARKGWFTPETQILLPRLVSSVALPPYLFYTITHSFGRDQLHGHRLRMEHLYRDKDLSYVGCEVRDAYTDSGACLAKG